MQRDSPFQLRTESDSEAKTLSSIQIAEGTLQQTQSSSLKAGRQMVSDYLKNCLCEYYLNTKTPQILQRRL